MLLGELSSIQKTAMEVGHIDPSSQMIRQSSLAPRRAWQHFQRGVILIWGYFCYDTGAACNVSSRQSNPMNTYMQTLREMAQHRTLAVCHGLHVHRSQLQCARERWWIFLASVGLSKPPITSGLGASCCHGGCNRQSFQGFELRFIFCFVSYRESYCCTTRHCALWKWLWAAALVLYIGKFVVQQCNDLQIQKHFSASSRCLGYPLLADSCTFIQAHTSCLPLSQACLFVCFILFYITDHTGMSTQFCDGDDCKRLNLKTDKLQNCSDLVLPAGWEVW